MLYYYKHCRLKTMLCGSSVGKCRDPSVLCCSNCLHFPFTRSLLFDRFARLFKLTVRLLEFIFLPWLGLGPSQQHRAGFNLVFIIINITYNITTTTTIHNILLGFSELHWVSYNSDKTNLKQSLPPIRSSFNCVHFDVVVKDVPQLSVKSNDKMLVIINLN